MRAKWFLTAIFAVGSASVIQAADYPVSGVWANAHDPSAIDVAASCASYLKNPKAPRGNIIVFKGSKKTEFNGGYLEEETVNNLAMRKLGQDEFQVVDSYYQDGEGGSRPGLKRRSYKLRILGPDKIEMKEGSYPISQFMRCESDRKEQQKKSATPTNLLSLAAGKPPTAKRTLVEPDRAFDAAGSWKILTARYGVGCIAVYKYEDAYSISIGGEKADGLSLVVEAARTLFNGGLDAEPYIQDVELVLGESRRGDLSPYGYRGTPGVVTSFDPALSRAFLESPSLKLTERGSVKLRIPLNHTKEMAEKLSRCFAETR